MSPKHDEWLQQTADATSELKHTNLQERIQAWRYVEYNSLSQYQQHMKRRFPSCTSSIASCNWGNWLPWLRVTACDVAGRSLPSLKPIESHRCNQWKTFARLMTSMSHFDDAVDTFPGTEGTEELNWQSVSYLISHFICKLMRLAQVGSNTLMPREPSCVNMQDNLVCSKL